MCKPFNVVVDQRGLLGACFVQTWQRPWFVHTFASRCAILMSIVGLEPCDQNNFSAPSPTEIYHAHRYLWELFLSGFCGPLGLQLAVICGWGGLRLAWALGAGAVGYIGVLCGKSGPSWP